MSFKSIEQIREEHIKNQNIFDQLLREIEAEKKEKRNKFHKVF